MKFHVRIYLIMVGQLGVDPLKTWKSIRSLPRYFYDLIEFKRYYTGPISLLPCLQDRYSESGDARGEYFTQDLIVARLIYSAQPKRHVDIGSRVDGFVAHVASFREIEVLDVRPQHSSVPGIIFKQADLMSNQDHLEEYCDSLSCLHALEHFGLGRYGDTVDPNGYILGFANLASMLKTGGTLYLSVPIGKECVEFNAHRIFNHLNIINLARSYRLQLARLLVINISGEILFSSLDYEMFLPNKDIYYLGVFVFRKLPLPN